MPKRERPLVERYDAALRRMGRGIWLIRIAAVFDLIVLVLIGGVVFGLIVVGAR